VQVIAVQSMKLIIRNVLYVPIATTSVVTNYGRTVKTNVLEKKDLRMLSKHATSAMIVMLLMIYRRR